MRHRCSLRSAAFIAHRSPPRASGRVGHGPWVAGCSARTDAESPAEASCAQVSSESPTDPAEIGGYSIIQADSPDEAAAVLQSHPYVARGGTLQINEIIEV